MSDTTEVGTPPPSVIAKIQKLLARTKEGRGASEAEADTAMNIAQELMSKWNLDMATVEAAGASNADTGAVRVKEGIKGKAMYKWQQELAKYVAEANFCYHMLKSDSTWVEGEYVDNSWGGTSYRRGHYKTVKSHVFIGRKSNVVTAQMMYAYLTQTIEDNVPVENNAQRLSRSAMSWKEGCSDRLCERLSQKRQDLIREHDARVRQQEADQKAERERSTAEAREREARKLAGNPEAEVKAVLDNLAGSAHDATAPVQGDPDPERPEGDETDTWTPGDTATPAEAPQTTSALVLASVYDDNEREANYEMGHGLKPGSLAKWRRERDEERAKEEREAAEEAAKEETAKVDAPIKAETEKQQAARLRRESEERAKNRRRWARESAADARKAQREWDRKDHGMYAAGAEKGTHIGLDPQVKAKSDTKKLKS